jgi:general secretion pathway protein A
VYLEFFGLQEKPFSTSPDPRYLYLSTQHREALAKVEYAAAEKLGLSAVYGDIGVGKTTIARRLWQKFQDENGYTAAMLPHPNFPTENQLLKAILQEFRVTKGARRSKFDLMAALNEFLVEQWKSGKTTVLIIDEAQALKPPLLELLREILNFETNTEKLLQIVLFGQNELQDRLSRKPSIKSRVAIYGVLSPLSRAETDSMIEFRYRVAGGKEHPFEQEALDGVYKYSKGTPRAINVLADNALIKALMEESPTVTPKMVESVAQEVGSLEPASKPGPKVGRPKKSEKAKEEADAVVRGTP